MNNKKRNLNKRLIKKISNQRSHLAMVIVKFGFGYYQEQAKQVSKWLKNITFE